MLETTPPVTARYPWRLFLLLWTAAIAAVLAIVPYLQVVLAATLATRPLPLPLFVVALIQGATNFAVAVGLGLLLARQLGLGAPILENWLYRRANAYPRDWFSSHARLALPSESSFSP